MTEILRVDGLTFSHGDAPLFSDWSASFGAGVTVIRGDTGSGKTTLIRLLSGREPVDGTMAVNGIRLADDPIAYRREFFWCDPTSEDLNDLAPTALFDRWQQDHPRFDRDALPHHIDGFSLSPHIAKPMYQLSTGSRRKVVLAGALASGAAVTLLDDPASALDGPSIGHLMRALQAFAAHPSRAWIVASYEALARVPDATLIDLPA